MKISLIAAIATNNAIGKDNNLLWHLPADMKIFKEKTTGHCIVTGRKNYESIPEKFRPLPNRTNIVITRNPNYNAPGAIVASSVQEAIEIAKQKGESELFIIGGAEIYKQTIDIADTLYITHVDGTFEADAFFPEITSSWKQIEKRDYVQDEKNKYNFSLIEYTKTI
ncbi:MAG: dihydrofolate reductase [Bacteroidetes bacterium]|nr:dihydrofolate reductase [Bacteroidota bacterium]